MTHVQREDLSLPPQLDMRATSAALADIRATGVDDSDMTANWMRMRVPMSLCPGSESADIAAFVSCRRSGG